MNHFVFAVILIIIRFMSSYQQKIYSFIPLCCGKSEIFNDSQCITAEDDEFTQEFPYLFYESDLNSTVQPFYTVKPLDNCSHFIDIPVRQTNSAINGIFVYKNSSITLNVRSSYENFFAFKNVEFCLLKYSGNMFSVRLCTKVSHGSYSNSGDKQAKNGHYLDCKKNICISKCCGEGFHVSFNPRPLCLPVKDVAALQHYYPKFKFINGSEESISGKNISYIVQFPLCRLYDIKELNLLTNGSVYIPRTKELIHRDKYCLDLFQIRDNLMEKASVCSEVLELTVTEEISRTVHPVGLLISCIFLAVTFICHVIIPKLRDMQGLCFMSYVFALFFAFLLLSLNILIPRRLSEYGCVVLAVLNYYSLMSAFFWLNVMCFDIWKIIRGTVQSIQLSKIHNNNKKTFIVYSIYAWGSPLVASIATLIMHFLPEGSVPDYVIRPQFLTLKCWFSNDIKVLFAYFAGIISVLLSVNLIFIIHTSVLLYKAGVAFTFCRTRKSFITESSNLRGNERLFLNMFWHRFCLFALMAINWSTEVLSFIPPVEMWVLTDILNTLQGLFVFILFLRSTKKRMMLKEAWRKVITTARRKIDQKKKKKTSKEEDFQVRFLKEEEEAHTENAKLSISEIVK